MKELSQKPDYEMMWKVECELNKELQEQNKILKEALEFYADGDNYGHINPEVATYSVIDNCDLGVGDFMLNETVDDERVGGKRAREALAKVNE